MIETTTKTGIPLTREGVSEILGVSISTVDRMKKRGILKVRERTEKGIQFEKDSVIQAQEYLYLRELYRLGELG